MPRPLLFTSENTPSWVPGTGALMAFVAFLVALFRGAKMPDHGTKVMGAVAIGMGFCLLGYIFGPKRRRSGHWFVQYGAWASHYFPTLIAFYVGNTVWSSSQPNRDHMLGYFLLLGFSSQNPHSMTLYTLGGSRPVQSWRLVQYFFYVLFLQWVALRSAPVFVRIVMTGMLTIWVFLLVPQSKKMEAILEHDTKAFADYMKQESTLSSPFFDGDDPRRSLKNHCKYPFMQKDGHWVKIKDLIQCKKLLKCSVDLFAEENNNEDTGDANIWLSYSLFQLLARRYFGFHCVEEGHSQVRDFTLRELLHGGEGYKRAFDIVEVQLAFLHDYFFTRYHRIIANRSRPGVLPVKLKIMIAVLCPLLQAYLGWHGIRAFLLFYVKPGVYEFLFTLASMFLSATLVVLHYFLHALPMYWQPIDAAFKNYPTAAPGSADTTIAIERNFGRPIFLSQPYWKEKMGQYSLIKDYECFWAKKLWKVCVALFKEYILSEPSPCSLKHHAVEEKDFTLNDEVKRTVALTLCRIGGQPTNGSRTLQIYRDRVVGDLLWTLRQNTHTHTILIWHIATCYCDILEGTDSSGGVQREVATSLSRYCAYLVAFLPEFLPEQRLTSKIVLQEVLEDAHAKLSAGESNGSLLQRAWHKAKRILGLRTMDLRAVIMGMTTEASTMKAFDNGIRLGRQLYGLNNTLLCWELMAEFWAETILYIAPSDNVAAHVEQLAKGGEFVTHIWALLSNAGILKRARDEWSPPQPSLRRSMSLPTS